MRLGIGRGRRRAAVGIVCSLVASAVLAWAGNPEPQGLRTLELEVTETASIVVSRKTIGFADSDLYFMSPDDVGTTLDMMQSAGVNSVRIMIPWAGVEKNPGEYNWTAVDNVVNAAHARGMGIVGLVNATPQWAAKPGTPALSGPPASNAVYADFANRVATRYRGKIAAYEVWNEPNATVFWSTGPDPAAYTQMLKAAYPAIKAGDPNAIVLGGALSPVKHPSGSMTAYDFLRGMYANGAKGSFDALSYHPYGAIKFSKGAYTKDAALYQFTKMRQLMVKYGDSKKLIWATEYGVETGYATEAQQADYIKDMLTKWRLYSYAGPAFIYTTRDGPINAGSYGVWRIDWTAKAAVATILKFTGGPVNPPATLALMVAATEGAPEPPALLAAALNTGAWALAIAMATAHAFAESLLQSTAQAVAVMSGAGETSTLEQKLQDGLQQREMVVPEPEPTPRDDSTIDSVGAQAYSAEVSETAAAESDSDAQKPEEPTAREPEESEESEEPDDAPADPVEAVDGDVLSGADQRPDHIDETPAGSEESADADADAANGEVDGDTK